MLKSIDPRKRLGLADWLERHVNIPQSHAKPGPIRLYPYQRAIAEAIDDPNLEEVSLMVYSQMGKSLLMVGAALYAATESNTNAAFAMPSTHMIRRYSKRVIKPVIDASAYIKNRLIFTNQGNISYEGIQGLVATVDYLTPTANAGFGNVTAALVLADEIDAYEETLNKGGSALDLLYSRGQSYGDRFKAVVSSTPSIVGDSKIEAIYNEATMEEWFCPCPRCGVFEYWQMEHCRQNASDVWALFCPHCDFEFDEPARLESIGAGHFRATNPNPKPGRRSFHLSQLVSYTSTIARTFSLYKEDDLIGFMNQRMGLPFNPMAHEPPTASDVELLMQKCPYPARNRVARCVGVDPGNYGMDVQVVDFYATGDTTPHIHIQQHYKIIAPRQTDFNASWKSAYKTLNDDVRLLKPDMVFIDVGNRFEEQSGAPFVLNQVKSQTALRRLWRQERLMPIKGTGHSGGIGAKIRADDGRWFQGAKKKRDGSPAESTLMCYVDNAKSDLYELLADAITQAKSGQEGRPIVTIEPDRLKFTDTFFAELAESYILKRIPKRNGRLELVWTEARKGAKRREGFDCLQYAWLGLKWLDVKSTPPARASKKKLEEMGFGGR